MLDRFLAWWAARQHKRRIETLAKFMRGESRRCFQRNTIYRPTTAPRVLEKVVPEGLVPGE